MGRLMVKVTKAQFFSVVNDMDATVHIQSYNSDKIIQKWIDRPTQRLIGYTTTVHDYELEPEDRKTWELTDQFYKEIKHEL